MVVSTNHMPSHRFRYKIALGQESQRWHTRVVMSSLPADQLPHAIKPNNGVNLVCKVESQLSRFDMRRKNHKWYHLKKEHHLAQFDVKMLIGTGLKFEIWGKDEFGNQAIRSKKHDEIHVAWEAPDGEGYAGKSPVVDEAGIYPI
jgi:hypothetical protein